VRAAFHQPPRGLPLSERDGVVQWCAAGDDCAVGLDVGASVEQGVEGFDVSLEAAQCSGVSVCGPVNRA